MKKKVVAHFIRKSTQLNASFIQNQILNHIDYKPMIIFKYESEKQDGGFAEFNNEKIPILALWDDRNLKSKLLYKYPKLISLKDVKKINAFLDKTEVDILHFHYGTDAGIYYPFLKHNKRPSVVSFYGYDCSGFPLSFYGFGRRYLNKRVFPFVNKVFAMSPDMKKDLELIGCPPEKIDVHYHGCDVERFKVQHSYSDGETVNFLIISGLEPQKGHIFLLKAFHNAYKKNKKIRLKIFGDGQLKEKIKNYITQNDIANAQTMGEVLYGSQEHLDQFKSADIFIHPSVTDLNGDKEGIPGAVIEAMAAGLPVISTYHAGIPFVIENNNTGLLVNEWDFDALTAAILKLANDNTLRKKLGRAAQEFALINLNLYEKELELEEIYTKLIH